LEDVKNLAKETSSLVEKTKKNMCYESTTAKAPIPKDCPYRVEQIVSRNLSKNFWHNFCLKLLNMLALVPKK